MMLPVRTDQSIFNRGTIKNLRIPVYLVIHDSGWVCLGHLLLAWFLS